MLRRPFSLCRSVAGGVRAAATGTFASQQQGRGDRQRPSPSRSSVRVDTVRQQPSSGPAAFSSTPDSRQSRVSADQQMATMRRELEASQRELRELRLQLAQQQHTCPGGTVSEFTSRALQQLAKVDQEAQAMAAELHYTAMALQCSQDRLEVELRRLLAIGLTAEEVDAAAIEAGARRYIRSNIGYRVEHVNEEVASTVNVSKSRDGTSTTSTRLG